MKLTISAPIRVSGIALHSGDSVVACLKPGHQGIRFFTPLGMVPALADFVSGADHRTVLRNGRAWVETPEHLMSALFLLGVTDMDVFLNESELPILDGSVKPWLDVLSGKLVKTPGIGRAEYAPTRAIEVCAGDSWARIFPSDKASLKLHFDFGPFGPGKGCVDIQKDLIEWGISNASARTFATESQIYALRSRGLAKGGSLDNSLVYSRHGQIMNEGGLRLKNEAFVHKALDAIGDLALLPFNWLGRVEAYKPGHAIMTTLAKEILSDYILSRKAVA
jgi:UDP-3-O-[3-hydroxymyristoyl] N-acetylglucosamine deacetylase